VIRRQRRRVGGGGGDDQSFQSINITPFTDVLLVLVIIFLIAGSSLAPTGVDVDKIQRTGTTSEETQEAIARTLTIASGGRLTLRIGSEVIENPELETLARKGPLTLTASGSMRVESVVKIYDRLLNLGFEEVYLGEPMEASQQD